MDAKEREGLRRAVQDVTERYRQAGYFSDASVRIFDRQGTLCSVTAGSAREDSWFDVASLTKIATATQALFLIRDGRLELETPITEALPELGEDSFLSERMRGITIRMLMTHTSGLPAWFPFYTVREKPFPEVLKIALKTEKAVPGVVYSDLNFMLLGKVLEEIQGKPLSRCLREDLAEPLGLGGMTYLPDPAWDIIPSSWDNAIEERMCAERGLAFDGFRPQNREVLGEVNDGNCWYYFSGVSGHAGIFAQAEAYERLCRFYLNTEDPLLIQAQQEQTESPGRGLGFQTGISYPHGCGHTGFTGTGIYLSRELGVGAISFTNRLYVKQPCDGEIWEYRRVLHEIAACSISLC